MAPPPDFSMCGMAACEARTVASTSMYGRSGCPLSFSRSEARRIFENVAAGSYDLSASSIIKNKIRGE